MFEQSLGKLFVPIEADLSGFKAGMQELANDVAKAQSDMEKLTQKMGKQMIAVGAAITAAIGLSVREFAKTGEAIYDMSKRTGLSTQSLSELSYAAKMSGADLSSLQTGLRTLSSNLANAEGGSAEAQQAFEAIGVSWKDLAKLPLEDKFLSVLEAINGTASETDRLKAAQTLLGRSGLELLPIMAEGRQGLEALRKEARDLGVTFDEETAKKADALADSIESTKEAVKGFMMAIGSSLAPMLTNLAKLISGIVSGFTNLFKSLGPLGSLLSGTAGTFGVLFLAGGTVIVMFHQLTIAAAAFGITLHTLLPELALVAIAITALIGLFDLLGGSGDKAHKKLAAAIADEIAALEKEKQAYLDVYNAEIQALRDKYGVMANEGAAFTPTMMDLAQQAHDKQDKLWDEELETFLEQLNIKREQAEKHYRDQIAQIEAVADAQIKVYQDQLDALDALDRAERKGGLQARKAQLESLLEVVQTEEERGKLLEELGQVERDIVQENRQEQRASIAEAMQDVRDKADEQKTQAQAAYEAEQTALDTLEKDKNTYYANMKLAADTALTEELTRLAKERRQFEADQDAMLKTFLDRIKKQEAAARRELTPAAAGKPTVEEQIAQEQVIHGTVSPEGTPTTSIKPPMITREETEPTESGVKYRMWGTTTAAQREGMFRVPLVGPILEVDFEKWLAVGNVIRQQFGGFGITTKPTLFMTSEHGQP